MRSLIHGNRAHDPISIAVRAVGRMVQYGRAFEYVKIARGKRLFEKTPLSRSPIRKNFYNMGWLCRPSVVGIDPVTYQTQVRELASPASTPTFPFAPGKVRLFSKVPPLAGSMLDTEPIGAH